MKPGKKSLIERCLYGLICFVFSVWPALAVDGIDQAEKTKPEAQSPDANGVNNDFTEKLKLIPGISIVFPIYDGVDTRGKKIGNYEFTVKIKAASDDGYSFDWKMSNPADAVGMRAVAPEDEKDAHQVSLFYSKNQTCTMSGFTNTVRVSDAIYKDLKAVRPSAFSIDLEEEKNVPTKIRADGIENVVVIVDGKKATVRAIKAVTDNGWNYWIMDNPDFPVLVKGDGPFRWSEPRFSIAEAESKRLTDELERNGVASSNSILFAFNSAKLEPGSKKILDGLAGYLTKRPDLRTVIEGHCDNVGLAEYNLKLSQSRADAVKLYLVAKGVPGEKLKSVGMGFSAPVADNATPEGRAQNRRVVFRSRRI